MTAKEDEPKGRNEPKVERSPLHWPPATANAPTSIAACSLASDHFIPCASGAHSLMTGPTRVCHETKRLAALSACMCRWLRSFELRVEEA